MEELSTIQSKIYEIRGQRVMQGFGGTVPSDNKRPQSSSKA